MDHQPWWKGTRGEWYVILQFVLFGLLFVVPFVWRTPAWPAPWGMVARVAGLLLGLLGAVLIVGGLRNLGANLTAVPHPKDDAYLVQDGAYRYVRHPIYSGIIFGGFGWALLMNSWPALVVAAGLFIFFDIKTRREERFLAAKFPDYDAYRGRVRKLVPFIY